MAQRLGTCVLALCVLYLRRGCCVGTFYVKLSAVGGQGCGSSSNPCASIAEALQQGGTSLAIFLYPGLYTGTNNTGLYLNTTQVSVVGLSSPLDVVIDCAFQTFGFALNPVSKVGPVVLSNLSFVGCSSALKLTNIVALSVRACVFQEGGQGNDAGGGLALSFSQATISNSTFIHNSARLFGGAIAATSSNLSIEQCIFTNNTAETGYGGGIFTKSSRLYITHATFANNSAWQGGAACVVGDVSAGSLEITKVTFLHNLARKAGGAIYSFLLASPLVAYDCTFIKNSVEGRKTCYADSCTALGGAMAINDGTFNVTNCTFRSNHAITKDYQVAYGGAIYTHSYIYASGFISQTVFYDNCVAGASGGGAEGGAMSASGVHVQIRDCKFVGNYARSSSKFSQQLVRGGAILIQNSNKANITNSNFTSNFVLGGLGGAVAIMDESHCTVTSSAFLYNIAFSSYSFKGQGGAIAVLTQSVLILANSTCDHNSARPRYIPEDSSDPLTYSGEGGAVFVQSAQSSIESTDFVNNTALTGQFDSGSRGGAVAFENVAEGYLVQCLFAMNLAVGGSASTISSGGSGEGGAVSSKFANPVIVLCNFQSNFASAGSTGFGSGGAISQSFVQSATSGDSSGQCGSVVTASSYSNWSPASPDDGVTNAHDVLYRMLQVRQAHVWFEPSEIHTIITSNLKLQEAATTSHKLPQLTLLPYGVYYGTDALVILLCTFRGNGAFGESTEMVIHRAGVGGAISIVQANLYINDTTFEENLAHTLANGIICSFGGGLYVNDYSNVVGQNITFTRNVAYYGWGDDIMTITTATSSDQNLQVSIVYPVFEVASVDERSNIASSIEATFQSLIDLIPCYWTQVVSVSGFTVQPLATFANMETGRRYLSDHVLESQTDLKSQSLSDISNLENLRLETPAAVFVMGGVVCFVEPSLAVSNLTANNRIYLYIGNFVGAFVTSTSVTSQQGSLFLIGDLPSAVFDVTALNSNVTVIDTKHLAAGLEFRQLRLLNSSLFTSSNLTVLAPDSSNRCVLMGSTMNGKIVPLPESNVFMQPAIDAAVSRAGLQVSGNVIVVARMPTIQYDCNLAIGAQIVNSNLQKVIKQTRDSIIVVGLKLSVTSDVYLSRNSSSELQLEFSVGGHLYVGPLSRVFVSGRTRVTSTLQSANAIINDGHIQVGQKYSQLVVDGDIVQSTGSIKIAIGNMPWGGPYISMASNRSLGGNINVSFDAEQFLSTEPLDDESTQSDVWKWVVLNFATAHALNGTSTTRNKQAEILAPPGIKMAAVYTVQSGYGMLEAVQITNMQCEVISKYVDTGGTGTSELCPTCLLNSSCVYCNDLCLTEGHTKGQCGSALVYTENCCKNNCNNAGTCNSKLQCDCSFFYDGSDCGNLSVQGAFVICSLFFIVLLAILSVRYYYYSRHEKEKVVNTTLDQLRQGLLGEDYEEKGYFTQNYLEDLQQELILRDVLVDFNQIEIEEKIGEGAFGEVFKATFRGAQVAVKMIKTHMFMDITDAEIEQIRKEAYLMSRLRHPNIVLIMGISVQKQMVVLPEDLDEDPNSKGHERRTLAIITEYLNQGSLADILHGENAIDSSLWNYELLLSCALQAARGMLYLHSHHPPICHRDLKSSNLIVDDHWVVKVTDFGMSRIMPDEALHIPSNPSESSPTPTTQQLSGLLDPNPGHSKAPAIVKTSTTSSFFSKSTKPQTNPSTALKQLCEDDPAHSMDPNRSDMSARSSEGSFSHQEWRTTDMGVRPGNAMYRSSFMHLATGTMMTSNLGTTSWCAPEMFAKNALTSYSLKVDIYSFGMVLFELWERQVPFSEYTSGFDIIDAIRAGRRPEISHNCPAPLRSLIQRCWHQKAEKRPTFQYIVRYLKDELGRVRRQRGTREPVVSIPSHILLSNSPRDNRASIKTPKQEDFENMDRTSWGLYNWKRWRAATSGKAPSPDQGMSPSSNAASRNTLAHPGELDRFMSTEVGVGLVGSPGLEERSANPTPDGFDQSAERSTTRVHSTSM